MLEESRTYEVESVCDKEKRFKVLLQPLESGVKAECDCLEYLCHGKWCEHIERAISCYRHGL